MDFRPNTNTLVANYLVTFGIVGLIIYMSTRPGNVVTYYYSPEYNSHASYGTSNCASCHTSTWSKVTDKNCSTAGCHTQFDAAAKSTADRLATTKNEFGHEKPHWGAILAFHDKVMGQTSCESCHPSHRLPQKGRFNGETILASLEQSGGIPRDQAALSKKRADAFHHGAELIAGKMSCNACHASMDAAGQPNQAGSAVAAAAQLAVPSAPPTAQLTPPGATPPPAPLPPGAEPSAISTPPPLAPADLPGTDATPASAAVTASNIATGDLASLPALGGQATATSSTQTGQSALPNLFEAAGKTQPQTQKTREDGSAEMPN
jgi:hypothetical protein